MCAEPVAAERTATSPASSDRAAAVHLPRAATCCSPRRAPAARRLRAVPDRVPCVDPTSLLTQAQWDDLAIPVDLVFLFQQSDVSDPAAASASSPATRARPARPSPSSTSSAWAAIAAANPALAALAADVEAVLLRRAGRRRVHLLLVPIDVCYELVGHRANSSGRASRAAPRCGSTSTSSSTGWPRGPGA